MAPNLFASFRRATLTAAALTALAAPISAQDLPRNEWQQGSALSLFGGVATPDGGTGPAAGGTITWEATPRLALDAGAVWLRGGPHDDVIFGSVGARYALTRSLPWRPYLSAGVGLYRASFDDDDPRAMPGFYHGRMMQLSPSPSFGPSRTFDDFAVRLGGGAEFFASSRISIRPEAQLILAIRRPDTHVVPVFGVHLVYHFESHPITPTRR